MPRQKKGVAQSRFDRYDFAIIPGPSKTNAEKSFCDIKNGSYLGGQVRMFAAAELSYGNPDMVFIAVGGYDENSEYSTEVSDMKKFLSTSTTNIVIGAPSLPCTRHNLIAVFNKFGKTLHNKRLAVLTNFYHLPRILRHWADLAGGEYKGMPMPFPVCAESLTAGLAPFQNISAFLKRVEDEQNGMKCLELGTYRDTCLEKRFSAFSGVMRKYPLLLLDSNEQKRYLKKT
ncbi:MAG: hypothetical protein HYW88_02445 [Candidatus Sungbacteria bacterium]|nr:hypothetical protein [Candidatus Sungbacteria bacterium]